MTQPLVWKKGKFLQWETHLPYENQPQTSPIFSIKNIECYFQLIRVASSAASNLYLKRKDEGAKLESFSFQIYEETKGTSYGVRKFHISCCNVGLLSLYESWFTKQAINFSKGFSVMFLFVFEDSIGLQLPSEKPIVEKSTQVDLLASLHADVEYLSFDFGELLKNGNLSNVQMLCDGGTIPAHKAVLAARSKVFSDMFQNNTEENKSGLINMTTTDKSVMELCLEFIYKGKILNIPTDKASNLYVLGHVLKISSLTKVCADLMISNLCDNNYVTSLVVADKYNDDHFKCGVTDYISDHVYLLKTENWMKFSEEHTKTANRVLQKCMLKFI